MDNIKTSLDRLTELSDEQIEALETQIIAEFEMLEAADHTPESVAAMVTLADSIDQVRGETQRREAETQELTAKAEEASARIRKEEPAVTEEAPEAEEAAASDAIEASAETATEAEETIEEASADTVEAAAEVDEAPEEVEEAAAETAPAEETVTAAGDDNETDSDEIEKIIDEAEETEEPTEEKPADEDDEEDEMPFAAETEEAAAEESTEDNTINTNDEPLAQEEEATVTAAAEGFQAPADRRPKAQEIEAATVAITAGADIPGYSAGQDINKDDVSKAFIKRLDTMRRVSGGGDGEQFTVASFSTQYDAERTLSTDPSENASKIQSLVAAGGYGGVQVGPNYDIFDLGATSARPVRDALPRFAADRGSVRYIVPPSLADYTGAVGVWTQTLDTDGTSTKNVLVVDGATERSAELYAVTLQLQIGNLMARALPELVDRHNELALVQHSRIAELELLSRMRTSPITTAVTAGKVLGVARDFLVQMRKAAAGYRARHRIEVDRRLKAILPEWVVQAIAADLAMQMPGDDTLSVGINVIEGYLAALNVDVTTSPDQSTWGAAQAAGALNDFPGTFEWFLYAEGSFIFLDGGTLDLGVVRDSTLVGTNDYRMFVESFEGLGAPGVEALAITSTFEVTGEAAALTDTTPEPAV